ncbi:uncharacterized protein LOC126895571 [Daktulosphaira vitifoliae]|uniref:uncharacterized protein LOC126895571 n=1 Tax=Daktulosphaira vitifoliae TaxID=58002 RepID=UPI0021AAF967|nr:uncharacterized protein LOC126895571 [Daktulosphaira vitifoliae]
MKTKTKKPISHLKTGHRKSNSILVNIRSNPHYIGKRPNKHEDATIQKPEISKRFQSKNTINVSHVKKITKKQTTVNKRQVKNFDTLILKRKNQTCNKSNAKISTKNKSNSINVEIPSEADKHMNEIINNSGEQENVRINNSETHQTYRKKNRTSIININICTNPHYVGKRPNKRIIIKFYKDLLTFDEDEDSRIQKPETFKTFQSKKRTHLDDVNDSRKKLRLTNKYEEKVNNSYTLNSNRKNKIPDKSNVEISTENKSNPINVEIPSDNVNHMKKLVNNIELFNNVDGINNFDTPTDNPTKNKRLSTNSSTKKISKKKRSK